MFSISFSLVVIIHIKHTRTLCVCILAPKLKRICDENENGQDVCRKIIAVVDDDVVVVIVVVVIVVDIVITITCPLSPIRYIYTLLSSFAIRNVCPYAWFFVYRKFYLEKESEKSTDAAINQTDIFLLHKNRVYIRRCVCIHKRVDSLRYFL